jgi:hypothetical protein
MYLNERQYEEKRPEFQQSYLWIRYLVQGGVVVAAYEANARTLAYRAGPYKSGINGL